MVSDHLDMQDLFIFLTEAKEDIDASGPDAAPEYASSGFTSSVTISLIDY